jgi:plastocyanin
MVDKGASNMTDKAGSFYYSGKRTTTLLLVLFFISSICANAETLSVSVISKKGKPVNDAVVVAVPVSGNIAEAAKSPTAVIDQVDKEYKRHVTPVMVGTAVTFPNHDEIRHHVYSFSPTKKFEIPLYTGTPRDPIVFDKAGSVSLGCNIHDWMSAYVYIVDSPYFATTGEDGKATINLPGGDYNVTVWHPRLRGSAKSTEQKISTGGSENLFTIKLKKLWKPRRAPMAFKSRGGGYR